MHSGFSVSFLVSIFGTIILKKIVNKKIVNNHLKKRKLINGVFRNTLKHTHLLHSGMG